MFSLRNGRCFRAVPRLCWWSKTISAFSDNSGGNTKAASVRRGHNHMRREMREVAATLIGTSYRSGGALKRPGSREQPSAHQLMLSAFQRAPFTASNRSNLNVKSEDFGCFLRTHLLYGQSRYVRLIGLSFPSEKSSFFLGSTRLNCNLRP